MFSKIDVDVFASCLIDIQQSNNADDAQNQLENLRSRLFKQMNQRHMIKPLTPKGRYYKVMDQQDEVKSRKQRRFPGLSDKKGEELSRNFQNQNIKTLQDEEAMTASQQLKQFGSQVNSSKTVIQREPSRVVSRGNPNSFVNQPQKLVLIEPKCYQIEESDQAVMNTSEDYLIVEEVQEEETIPESTQVQTVVHNTQ